MQHPDIQAGIRRCTTCGEAWIWLMNHVRRSGTPAQDDRGPVIEALPVLFEIEDVRGDDPIIAAHGDASKIPLYARKFTTETIVPPFKYSYGARLRHCQGVDQLAWVTRLLRARPYSKSGWISLTTPGEPMDAVPCLTGVAFRMRRERLEMTAAFRSQNAFTSYLNYMPLREVQQDVARRLRASCGAMRVFVDVPHIYVADLDRVARILRETTPAPSLRRAS
ncbi:thymidylate synthase [Thermocatellispora tengchongensis]|uniref:Thymidylate synthase n=1 Tax=Thermocatellispora tengchongensis TaxID=1073253 RepID=A0A840NTS7_9ACTN|nr:thymidylate synthase [Thermocatellispora tengchongensis]MBB5130978.1 thymidylate synthase [Thermocatellispora tengchongensis]